MSLDANAAKGIIVMVGSNEEAVGAMYTQRIRDGGLVDSTPWKESVAETSGLVSRPQDNNIDMENGMVKQLMRVSTKRGGGGVDKYVPGTTLREFALNLSAAEGIKEVVSLLCCRCRQSTCCLQREHHDLACLPRLNTP